MSPAAVRVLGCPTPRLRRPGPDRRPCRGRPVRRGRGPGDRGARARRPGARRPGADGRGRRRRRWSTASTCSCRPAPAPASRWPTSCPACCTTSGSWSRPRRSRSSTSSSSATCPRLVEAVEAHPGVDASYAVLKGRSNYACLHRIREGVPDDQGVLSRCPTGSLGKKVLELRRGPRSRPRTKGSGERDNAPRHTDREWRQVSVGHRDCLGAAKCPFGQECFVERGPREGAPLAPDRHQPLAARDRRHRGRADDPGLRRRGHRRGPRADRAGHPGRHRRAERGRRRAGGPPLAAPRRRRPGRRPRRRRRRAARRDRRVRPRPLRAGPASTSPTRWCWCATRPAPASRRTPRTSDAERRRRRPHPGAGLGAGGLRRRRADGRRPRVRRALALRGRRADPAAAVRRAAAGVGPDARQAAHRQDRRVHLARR